jgi:hypothetical protein
MQSLKLLHIGTTVLEESAASSFSVGDTAVRSINFTIVIILAFNMVVLSGWFSEE